MDKYQASVLKLVKLDFRTINNKAGSAKFIEDTLELTQNENYNLKEFYLTISNCKISKIKADNQITEGNKVKIDFDHKAKSLTLYLENDIVDPIELKLSYIEAEKAPYDIKVHEAECRDFIEKASIKCATGPSLVNIYFQPCDEKCSYTRIKLYTAKGRFEELHGGCCVIPPNWKPTLIGGEIEQMIGNYTVEEGSLFKSINGLANGVYGYTVSQYDKNDRQLFETDPKYFILR